MHSVLTNTCLAKMHVSMKKHMYVYTYISMYIYTLYIYIYLYIYSIYIHTISIYYILHVYTHYIHVSAYLSASRALHLVARLCSDAGPKSEELGQRSRGCGQF